MNKHHKTVTYFVTFMVSLLAFSIIQAENKLPENTKTTPQLVELSPLIVDDPTLHPAYNLYLLTQGRAVYQQLKTAKQAVSDKDMAALKASLDLAQEALENLQVAKVIEDIDKQQAIIHRDLKNIDPHLGEALWIPVDATLSTAIVLDSDTKAKKDKLKMKDVGLEVSDYRLGIFPLNRTKQDVSLAVQSVQAFEPSWDKIAQTVKTAFDDVKWFFKVPTQGLASAYAHVINAQTLASNQVTGATNNQQIIKQLKEAKKELQKVSDTQALQGQTQALINQKEPSASDISDLVGFFQEKLRYIHDQSADKFMDESATEAISPD